MSVAGTFAAHALRSSGPRQATFWRMLLFLSDGRQTQVILSMIPLIMGVWSRSSPSLVPRLALFHDVHRLYSSPAQSYRSLFRRNGQSIRRNGQPTSVGSIFSRGGHADVQKHQNTNVVEFYALLDKCCPLKQIVYYQVRPEPGKLLLPSRLNFDHVLNFDPPRSLASELSSTQESSALP